MKSLIISDCHDKTDQIQRIMDSEPADEVILHSDFFDEWKKTEITAVKTARGCAGRPRACGWTAS